MFFTNFHPIEKMACLGFQVRSKSTPTETPPTQFQGEGLRIFTEVGHRISPNNSLVHPGEYLLRIGVWGGSVLKVWVGVPFTPILTYDLEEFGMSRDC